MSAEDKTAVEKAWELAGDPEKIRRYYRDWAGHYDADVEGEDYHSVDSMLSPMLDSLNRAWPNHDKARLRILDVGCGTGLIGLGLAERGYHNIDGFDLSADMVAQAQAKGCYQSLFSDIDLCQPLQSQLPQLDYHGVVCVGVLTLGHVSPDGIKQLVEAARPDGIIGFSARDLYAEQHDLVSLCAQMQADGLVRVIFQQIDKLIGNAQGLFTVLQRTDR